MIETDEQYDEVLERFIAAWREWLKEVHKADYGSRNEQRRVLRHVQDLQDLADALDAYETKRGWN